ncbi:hypothetical protein GCM10027268_07740 [Brachybacterium huguangmaarense]
MQVKEPGSSVSEMSSSAHTGSPVREKNTFETFSATTAGGGAGMCGSRGAERSGRAGRQGWRVAPSPAAHAVGRMRPTYGMM